MGSSAAAGRRTTGALNHVAALGRPHRRDSRHPGRVAAVGGAEILRLLGRAKRGLDIPGSPPHPNPSHAGGGVGGRCARQPGSSLRARTAQSGASDGRAAPPIPWTGKTPAGGWLHGPMDRGGATLPHHVVSTRPGRRLLGNRNLRERYGAAIDAHQRGKTTSQRDVPAHPPAQNAASDATLPIARKAHPRALPALALADTMPVRPSMLLPPFPTGCAKRREREGERPFGAGCALLDLARPSSVEVVETPT